MRKTIFFGLASDASVNRSPTRFWWAHWALLVTVQTLIWRPTCADIFIQDKENNTVEVYNDYELNFGMPVPDDGIWAVIQQSQPTDACEKVDPPDHDYPYFQNTSYKWFALVDRAFAYCDIQTKIVNVMKAGYDGIIIYNAIVLNPNSPSLLRELNINIPVLLVTHSDGVHIAKKYLYKSCFHVLITNNSSFNYYPYLLPFLAVIGICLLVMLSFMVSQIVRCYHERKKRMKHRLAKKYLKKLPVVNFKKGDQYEVCAICLDEFTEGTKLRLLPCNHAYHLKCIDPWLTKNRRNCPICKGKVVVPGMSESESDSDVEHQNSNERTPLLFSGSESTSVRNGYGVGSAGSIGPFGRRSSRMIGHPLPPNWNPRAAAAATASETVTTGSENAAVDDLVTSNVSHNNMPVTTVTSGRSRKKKHRLVNICAEITPGVASSSTTEGEMLISSSSATASSSTIVDGSSSSTATASPTSAHSNQPIPSTSGVITSPRHSQSTDTSTNRKSKRTDVIV